MYLFSGRSGRPTFFTAVFNTFTPAIKESWVSSLQMAKLALGKTQGLADWACSVKKGMFQERQRGHVTMHTPERVKPGQRENFPWPGSIALKWES